MAGQSVGKIYAFAHPGTVIPEPPPAVELLARVGIRAKGVAYLTAGLCLFLTAFVGSGRSQALHGVIAAGLLCYAVWRFVQAAVDPDFRTRRHLRLRSPWRSALRRVWYATSGLAYAVLAVAAVRHDTLDWVARILDEPWGHLVAAILGGGAFAFGLQQVYVGHWSVFLREYDPSKMPVEERELVSRSGRLGYTARGMALMVVGALLVRAAAAHAPVVALAVDAQPYGGILLGIFTVGVAAYGLYCFSEARQRRFVRRAY
jgi:hypothetical protein